jgi:hypothetical protein
MGNLKDEELEQLARAKIMEQKVTSTLNINPKICQGCSVEQLVVRWPAVGQARVQFAARQLRKVFPSE